MGASVGGEVFELGLGFQCFGVVEVHFGAGADGAEYVYVDEHDGVGLLLGDDFYAAQEEDGADDVAEEGCVLGIGYQGFVAVFAHAAHV